MIDEGEDIPVLSGTVTPEHVDRINAHQLIDGKSYKCDVCYKDHVAPFVSRCICGMKVCENCISEHESGW